MGKTKDKKNLDKQYNALKINIAKNLKVLRQMKGWTQEDMTSFGFERRWYQRIESGTHNISLQTLVRLAEVFNVEISELIKK